MCAEQGKTSRRSLLLYAFGSLGLAVTPSGDALPAHRGPNGTYVVVDRRELAGGGVGLFIAVATPATREQLLALAEALREEFREQGNAVVEVFDEVEAARTVRAGSRVVGEERFSAARGHQKGRYYKNAKAAQHTFTIYGEEAETIRLGGGN